ncbi:hypothetical protein K503DRAFT_781403 [Rhizopogon vinicolor AM-OR11-026]|uniref:Uncharacterized protein n=1 Tax=Rhizopogon vinicolor AM-OR11-026 TaxID=1314800 RepID=A0A1B7N6J0_9AGAM|nr:hypothetical protein K503DRAFT_781403 [Rhizopogon vinicolor AM-OR11-026]
MDRNFKFPPSQIQAQVVPPAPPVPSMQSPASKPESEADSNHATEENETPVTVVPPSSVEVPPPPPIEKESIRGYLSEEGYEEVGKTVEIDLRLFLSSYKATSQDSSGHNEVNKLGGEFLFTLLSVLVMLLWRGDIFLEVVEGHAVAGDTIIQSHC